MDRRRLVELGALGLLEERATTLEGLKERFNHNFGRYQFAGHGTLDPAVDRLRNGGHVTGARTLAVTDRGRERLRELLREPVEDVHDPASRPHLLVKLGFLHHLPEEGQLDELARLEDRFHEARAERIEVARSHDGSGDGFGYRQELLDLRIELLGAHLEWIGRLRESVSG